MSSTRLVSNDGSGRLRFTGALPDRMTALTLGAWFRSPVVPPNRLATMLAPFGTADNVDLLYVTDNFEADPPSYGVYCGPSFAFADSLVAADTDWFHYSVAYSATGATCRVIQDLGGTLTVVASWSIPREAWAASGGFDLLSNIYGGTAETAVAGTELAYARVYAATLDATALLAEAGSTTPTVPVFGSWPLQDGDLNEATGAAAALAVTGGMVLAAGTSSPPAVAGPPPAPPVASAVAVYRIDEAASGAAPTQLLDASGHGLHLDLTYVEGDPVFVTGANGRGIDFLRTSPFGAPGAGAQRQILASDAAYQAFNGSRYFLIEAVAEIPNLGPGDEFGPACLAGIFRRDGENDPLGLWWWNRRMVVDVTGQAGFEGGGYTAATFDYVNAPFAAGTLTPGVHVFHAVFDSTAASASDRLRLYVDGVRQTQNGSTGEGPGDQVVDLNDQIMIPLAGSGLARAGDHFLCVGGFEDYGFGYTGSWEGAIYWVRLHNAVPSDPEITTRAAALAANWDYVETYDQPISPESVASGSAVGQPAVLGVVSPGSVASSVTVGQPAVLGIVIPTSVASSVAVGPPTVGSEVAPEPPISPSLPSTPPARPAMQLDQPASLRLVIRPRAESIGRSDSLEELDVRELQTGCVANVADPLLPAGQLLYVLNRQSTAPVDPPRVLAANGGGRWLPAQASSDYVVDVFADYTGPLLALSASPQTLVTLNVTNPLAENLVCDLAWGFGARSPTGAPGIARGVLLVDGSPAPVQGNAFAICRPGGPATPASNDVTTSGVSRVTLTPGAHVVTLELTGVDFGSGANTLSVVGVPTGGGATYLWITG